MAATRSGRAVAGVEIKAPLKPEYSEILTPEALELVAVLHRAFDGRRRELLARRGEVQAKLDSGGMPDFLPETRAIRESDWKVAPAPPDLLDRRVEITGPVDRKMVINALNSGAKVFMADFEDAHSPTWDATIEGQINLRDAIRGVIEFTSPEGKQYRLEQADGHAAGPPARLAPGREARHGRRPGRLRLAVRLRPLPVPQRPGAAGQGDGPVLLPAQAREPPRGPALERRLRDRPARARAAAWARSRPRC